VPFDGKRFSRTAVNAASFSYLRPIPQGDENLLIQIFPSWKRAVDWLEQLNALRHAAQQAANIARRVAAPDVIRFEGQSEDPCAPRVALQEERQRRQQ
jgi:hypothetical protein